MGGDEEGSDGVLLGFFFRFFWLNIKKIISMIECI
jgi:hypothetical protein